MIKITNKSEIKVGDIVKHQYRKTLTFKITQTSPKVLIQRCDPISHEIQTRYKGYEVAPRDFTNGLITLVESSTDSPKLTTKTITVSKLEKKDLFGELKNIIAEFRNLESELSPENLTCDGELSTRQINTKRKEILRKWDLLEQFVGTKVEALI